VSGAALAWMLEDQRDPAHAGSALNAHAGIVFLHGGI
jgi:hypothetical protein